MAVGAVLFAIDASLARSDGLELNAGGYAVIGSLYAGLGAVAGAGIDALIGGNRTIYRRSGSAHVIVAPAVRPGRAEVRLAFSW